MKFLFLLPLVVGCIIQCVKVLIDYTVEKSISVGSLRGSGGFPSVHSGIASSICTLVWIYTGRSSIEFAICITFSFLFWYDAANVRYEAGQHASSLNQIQKELEKSTNLQQTGEILKERLGHTVSEVIGGVLAGILLTLLISTILLP